MNIAIQAADLDHERIDGTRVYIKELLARFGAYAPDDIFSLYHRSTWNPELAPPQMRNYHERVLRFPFYWTQTRFLLQLFVDRPDVLWMPMQSLPFITPCGLQKIVTIHDLAFKIFPTSFPRKDMRRLNIFTDFAVTHADHIIAVSHATKNDILRFYPHIDERKITVIYHGFNTDMFAMPVSDAERGALRQKYGIGAAPYMLYVGALQPRKNLENLVRAFELYAQDNSEIVLVLAGGKGWLWEPLMALIERSPFKERIILTGAVPFADLRVLYHDAYVFVFPSLYEGFGIPLLEAFAAGVPVVTARNSSLLEVGGDAALYAEATDVHSIKEQIRRACEDRELRRKLIARGTERLTHFSWDTCAQQTLKVLRGE